MAEMELRLRLTATDQGLKAQVVDAQGKLRDLGQSGERAGGRVAGGMRRAGAGVERLARSIDSVKRLLIGFASIQFARGLVGQLSATADSAANLAARIRLVTDSQAEFNQVQDELFRIAQRTRAPLEATADLYARMGPALKRITGSTGEALRVVETINQALATSGATAAESSGALLQLSQALAAGALRGDEFNSVMEGAPGIMRAIADGLGVPIGKLRELANAGKLTAEVVVGALQKSRDSVQRAFSEMPLTIGGALQQVENRWLQLIGRMDSASGVSRQVAEAIASAADYMDEALAAVVFTANAVTGAIRGIAGTASMVIGGVLDLLDTLTLGLSDTLGNLVESFRAAAEVNFKGLAQDIDDANAAFRQLTGATDAASVAAGRAGEQVARIEDRVRSASATAAASDLLPQVDTAKLAEFEAGLRRQAVALERLRDAALAGQEPLRALQVLQQTDNDLRRTGIDLTSSQAAAYRAVALALQQNRDALQQTAGLVERENAAYRTRLANLKAFYDAGLIDQKTYHSQAEQAARAHQKRLAQIERQGAALRKENERYAQRLALIEAAYRREELSAAEHQRRLEALEAEHQQRLAAIHAQYRQADQAAYQQYLAGLIAQAEQAYQTRLQALKLALDQGLVSEAEYRRQVEELEQRHAANLAQIRQNALQQYLQQLDRQAQAAEQAAGIRRQAAEETARAEVEAAVQAGQGVSDAARQAADNVQQAFARAAEGAGQALVSIAQTAENAFAQVQVNVGQAVAAVQTGLQSVAGQQNTGNPVFSDSVYQWLAKANPIGQVISGSFRLPDGTQLATDPSQLMFGGEQAILRWLNQFNALNDRPMQGGLWPGGPGWDLLQQYLHKPLPVSVISGGKTVGEVSLTSAEIERLLEYNDALDRAKKLQQEIDRAAKKYPSDIADKIRANLQTQLDALIAKFPDIKKALQDSLGEIKLPKIELPKIELPKIELPKIDPTAPAAPTSPAPVIRPGAPVRPPPSPKPPPTPTPPTPAPVIRPHRPTFIERPDGSVVRLDDAPDKERLKKAEKDYLAYLKKLEDLRRGSLIDRRRRETRDERKRLDDSERRYDDHLRRRADRWRALHDDMTAVGRRAAADYLDAWAATLDALLQQAGDFATTLPQPETPVSGAETPAPESDRPPAPVAPIRPTPPIRPIYFSAAGLPRYHSGGVAGLKPDEVPAILQKGELILTPQQARMLAPAGRTRVEVHVHNHAGVAVETRETATAAGTRIDIDLLAEQIEDRIGRRLAEGRGLARARSPYDLGAFS